MTVDQALAKLMKAEAALEIERKKHNALRMDISGVQGQLSVVTMFCKDESAKSDLNDSIKKIQTALNNDQ